MPWTTTAGLPSGLNMGGRLPEREELPGSGRMKSRQKMDKNMNDATLIDRISHAIADRIAPAVPIDIALWDSSTIAAYLKLSERVVIERVVAVIGFPQAIRLPTQRGTKGHPRWKASEVIAWAERHQEKRAA